MQALKAPRVDSMSCSFIYWEWYFNLLLLNVHVFLNIQEVTIYNADYLNDIETSLHYPFL